MSCIEVKDIAQYEETDSELAKYTISKLEEENERLNNIIKELEASAREIVRVGKNRGYQYIENLRELKTKNEVYDFIEFYYGLYLLETLNKLKEGEKC